MDFLTDWLTNWLKELLIGGIMGNLEGLTDYVNAQVGEIAVQVGTTPAAWNAGVFSLIRQLSETVILPIAGLVLTFVATYELIQMLLEKNNMHEFDVANIYKWMFKTACAILILSNTFSQGCVSIYFTLYYLWACWYFPNRQNKKSQSKNLSNIERNEVKQYGNEICRARYGTIFWNS